MGTLRCELRAPYKLASVGMVLAVLAGVVLAIGGRAARQRDVAGQADGSLKDTLQGKVQMEWSAFKSKDSKAYLDLLADDYVAVEVDGEGTRSRDQTRREIEKNAIDDFAISRFDARALGDDAAMVTYEAFLQFPPTAQVRFLRVYVTEIWVKRTGQWKALHYQETRVR